MKNLYVMLIGMFCLITINVLAQNPDLAQLKSNIEQMNKEYDQAMLSGDYNKINSFFADDALNMPSYSPMERGKDAISESTKKDLESTKYNSFTTKPMDVYGNGDLVYEIGTYQVNFTMQKNPTAMDDHGKYVNIWQKQNDGTWKIKVETWNSDSNPMANMNQAGAKTKDENSK
jgi:uncharacterized protein (TIGR02246 family)